MKLIFKLMLVALVLVGASPFIMPLQNGQPLIKLSNLKFPDFSSLFGSSQTSKVVILPKDTGTDSAKTTEENSSNKNVTTVHKWIDETGVVQFSDQLNPQGESELVKINTNSNVVKSTPVEKPEEKKVESDEQTTSTMANIPLPTTIPLSEVPKLMDKTKELKKTLEERYQQQETLLKDLSNK